MMDAPDPVASRGATTPPNPASATGATPSTAGPAMRGLRRPVSPFALIVVVAILAAAGLWGWAEMSRSVNAMHTDVARRLTAAEGALAQAQARESDLANELRDAQAKVALLETRLAEAQSEQASLEALYRELAPSQEELALTEVEQVLALASQQLALAGNAQAALAAVQLADAKLARLDRPRLLPLRRALARDMDALKAVPYVDVAGISVKLDQTLAALDTLPLARDERLPAPPRATSVADDPAWLKFLRNAWNDLKSVVRIEVSDRPPAVLLTPQEAYFLRENLRLRLLAARLALLSRDEAAFKADLADASAWLSRYFDTRVKTVQSAIATLTALRTVAMPTEMPDLGRTLDAVRTLKLSADRMPQRVNTGPAQAGPSPQRAR